MKSVPTAGFTRGHLAEIGSAASPSDMMVHRREGPNYGHKRRVRPGGQRKYHDVGLIRNVKPYLSKIILAALDRMKAM